MNNLNTEKKLSIKVLIIALLIAVLVFISTFGNIFSAFDYYFTDLLYQNKYNTNLPIYIIGIDDKSLDELGSYNDWSRQVYANLINNISTEKYSPKVIAFDILFTGAKDIQGDIAFAQAAEDHGNVIVASWLTFDKSASGQKGNLSIDYTDIIEVSEPYSALNAVTFNGFSNTAADSDGYMRHFYPYFTDNDTLYTSFAVSVLEGYWGRNITEEFKYNDYYFTYPYNAEVISLVDVLNGSFNPAVFDGAIVLVGAYAEGFGDSYPAAGQRSSNMYGVSIHAAIINAIYSGNIQHSNITSVYLTALVFAVFAALFFIYLSYGSIIIGAVLGTATIIAETIICVLSYRNGVYLSFIYLPIAIICIYVFFLSINYISLQYEKARINKAFKQYVSPQVVEEAAKSGNYNLKLGGQNKDIAVLFIDIRGFTTLSESLEPEVVVGILNEFFTVITEAIFNNGGTLDKYIGDNVMAVYNSPFDLDDYVYKAVKTAIDISSKTELLTYKLNSKYGKNVSFGVGINAGEATIGNIGCNFRMDFTAIGDTVNVASRLEANAKAGQILISEEIYNRIGNRLKVEDIGELCLKGKTVNVHAYNVLSII